MLRAKQILKNLALTSFLEKKVKNYRQAKQFINVDLYDMFWSELITKYLDNASKYLKGAAIIFSKANLIKKA